MLKENPETIKRLEQQGLLKEEDVWEQIRSIDSPVKSPKEEGFIFAPMPRTDARLYKSAVKALYVKNGVICVNDEIIDDESVIQPTNSQQELYEMVEGFCEALREKNFNKRLIGSLFVNTRDGIQPNIKDIIGNTWCRVKR